jgi:hypothetical protein
MAGHYTSGTDLLHGSFDWSGVEWSGVLHS